MGGGDLGGSDVHAAAVLIELHLAVDQGEESPIASGADVLASDELGAALANDNAAGGDMFPAEGFHTEPLAITIATVSAAALTFFMSHNLLKLNFFDF